MRIGQSIVYRNSMRDLMELQWSIDRIDVATATGQTMNAPSDKSEVATTVLTSRNIIEKVAQYHTNLETAETWLKAAETAMQSMVDSLTSAKSLAEQMATGTYTSEQRIAAAEEIDKIISELRAMSNVKVNESYVFGGTKNNLTPVNFAPRLPEPVPLYRTGTGTSAGLYNGGGGFQLRFSRDTTGQDSVFYLSGGSTLGNSIGLDFTSGNWTLNQAAKDSPSREQIITSNQIFASPASIVSSSMGETLTWLADPEAGWQTYRTEGRLTTAGGGGSLDINGQTINFTDTEDLVQQINQNSAAGCVAIQEGPDDIRLVSLGGVVTFASLTGVALDTDTTLQELQDAITNGVQATGSLTINSAPPAFPPKDTEYVRVGDLKATWEEIIGAQPRPATPADYAGYLANWLNSSTTEFSASVQTSGGNAAVTLTAAVPGTAGNVVLESNSPCLNTSGILLGGLDPAGQVIQQPGKIYGVGESSLAYATTIKGQVMDVTYLPNGELENVRVKLTWYDEDGAIRHEEVNLRDNGENGKVNVPGLGPDFYLHRDNLNYEVGASFELNLTHLNSNNETLSINYNDNNHMRFSWTAEQVLGDQLRQDMRGLNCFPRGTNTGDGTISLSGLYQGLYPKDVTFDVLEDSSLPPDLVKVRVSWTDDQGLKQDRILAVDRTGSGGSAVIPLMNRTPTVNLDGSRPDPALGNSSTGQLVLQGDYKGFTPREFSYEIIESGNLLAPQAPGNNDAVTVRVTWLDDEGSPQTQDLTFNQSGSDCGQEIPGLNGLKLYLEPGTYDLGDTFSNNVVLSPESAAEGIFFQMSPGVYNTGDSYSVHIPQDNLNIIDTLHMWAEALRSGDVEQGQTLSQRALEAIQHTQSEMVALMADSGSRRERITMRHLILDDTDFNNSSILEQHQEVDITTSMLELRALLTAYNTSMKVFSTMSDLSLTEYI